jgi:23S rRNA pseudouridine2605 synthase
MGKTGELSGNAKSSVPPGRPRSKNAFFGKPYKKSYRPKEVSDGGGVSQRRVRKIAEEESPAPKSDKIRLNKFIANSGVSSRREADEFITMGLISVNGKVITELGYKVNPGDEVRYENKVLHAEKPVYILMNKPKGFLTTTDDPQERKTVMHLLGAGVKERIYPVGRLDRNTTGLLLLTNDGDLADKLMHPSFNVKKIYKVELDKPMTKGDFQAIAEGVRLDEGRATVDDVAIVSDDKRTIGIELHIGWNRVVRRIFESLGYEVLKLDRTAYAGLDKKDLGRGEWRFLTKEEIIHLKHFK